MFICERNKLIGHLLLTNAFKTSEANCTVRVANSYSCNRGIRATKTETFRDKGNNDFHDAWNDLRASGPCVNTRNGSEQFQLLTAWPIHKLLE